MVVNITSVSGEHVFAESGVFVTTQPGIQVSGAVVVSGNLSASVSGNNIQEFPFVLPLIQNQ